MSDKVVTLVQTAAGGAALGSGFWGWLADNATLVSLGFTAATFVVYTVATWYNIKLKKKAMGL